MSTLRSEDLAPVTSGKLVNDFFTIMKHPHGPVAEAFLARCESYSVKSGGTWFKYYRCGDSGPTTLLVHGLHSNLATMVGIADRLLGQGQQVVLFDAPAHGAAPGVTTDPAQVRDLILAIAQQSGDLRALVGHSLGALWAVAALGAGLKVDAVVAVSSPADTRFLVDSFVAAHGLPADQVEELGAAIDGWMGPGVWAELSPLRIVASLDVPALVVHGREDDFVPWQHSADLHAAWPGSSLEVLDGVGHFDAVRSPEVRSLVADFLREAL